MLKDKIVMLSAAAGAGTTFIAAIFFAVKATNFPFLAGSFFGYLALALISAFLGTGLGGLAIRQYGRRVIYSVKQRVEKIASASERKVIDEQLKSTALAHDEFDVLRDNLTSMQESHTRAFDALGHEQNRIFSLLQSKSSTERIQNKLVAVERRLVATFETAALTIAGESADAIRSQVRELDLQMAELRSDIGDLRMVTTTAESSALASASSLADTTVARTQELRQQISELRVDVRDVYSTATEFEARTTRAFADMVEILKTIDETKDRVFTGFEELNSHLSSAVTAIQISDTQASNAIADGLSESRASLQQVQHRVEELYSLSAKAASDARLESITESSLSHTVALSEIRDGVGSLTDLIRVRDSEASDWSSAKLRKQLDDLGALLRQLFNEIDVSREDTQHVEQVLESEIKKLVRHIDRSGVEIVHQVESLLQLVSRVDFSSRRLPQSGGFAMNPDGVLLLADMVQRHRPKRILELGSGSSTIWLGMFAKSLGTELISIDHLEKYYALTAQMLEDFELEQTVELRLAPLVDVESEGTVRPWYDPSQIKDLTKIDMLLVDGPPQSTGPEARFPAFPMLRERLSPGALIVFDDVHRDQETKIIKDWMANDADLCWTEWSAGRTGVLRYRSRD